MSCFNIVDHRRHPAIVKCDAVLEPSQSQKQSDNNNIGITIMRKTTVASAVKKAQSISVRLTVWLYDFGTIKKDEDI